MESKKDFKNELMQRRELEVLIESEKNPTRVEVKKALAEKFKASEEEIIVERIKGFYGRKEFLITARIYDSKEAMKYAEPEAILQKPIEVKESEKSGEANQEEKKE